MRMLEKAGASLVKGTREIEHDLAQKHILQCPQSARVVLRAQVLEGFEEVGVGG